MHAKPRISPAQELLAQQPTDTLPAIPAARSSTPPVQVNSNTSIYTNVIEPDSDFSEAQPVSPPGIDRKARIKRYAALILCGVIAVALFITWTNAGTSQSSTSGITDLSTPPGASGTPTLASNQTGNDTGVGNVNTIQVYVIGAVKHPGVYTLPSGARIYQLLQAAGGTLGSANLALINMAAKLSDGQEVYVVSIGETPPPSASSGGGSSTATSSGQSSGGPLVNINTASQAEMMQALHISSITALHIIAYRQLHGDFTSIDQLLQVISSTTYKKIKDEVTI